MAVSRPGFDRSRTLRPNIDELRLYLEDREESLLAELAYLRLLQQTVPDRVPRVGSHARELGSKSPRFKIRFIPELSCRLSLANGLLRVRRRGRRALLSMQGLVLFPEMPSRRLERAPPALRPSAHAGEFGWVGCS